ncbi:MAG: hypothetical protein JNJ57_19550 [Saprospiraceae bacterium]|nr:hypothetical protein [Saprospiraceae bacterium]
MKYRKFFTYFPLLLLFIGSLLSFSTKNWGILYFSKAACESHEGAGKCAECDGGWHTIEGCCLITDVKKGDAKAIKKYTAILNKEYQNLKTEAEKARIAFDKIKITKASRSSIEEARKYAEETEQLATRSKAELNKFTNQKKN